MKSLAIGIKRFLKEEEGVTMVEYGLIAALIAIVCIIFITNVGSNLNLTFGEICNRLKAALDKAGVAGSVAC
jgi:pilus assembly protein Flp/PilA